MTYEFEAASEKEAIEAAAASLGIDSDQFDVEILEVQKQSLFKKGYVKIRVHVDNESTNKVSSASGEDAYPKEVLKATPIEPLEFERDIVDFIQTLVEKMGYSAKVTLISREDRKLNLKIASENSSILIGRKGKTLDALQLLANVYASKLGHDEVRIILDSENYRLRREESLVRLAYATGERVRNSHRSVLLELMNPYERRIIHTTLNDVEDVETKSEGEGLYKQVRVFYKGIR